MLRGLLGLSDSRTFLVRTYLVAQLKDAKGAHGWEFSYGGGHGPDARQGHQALPLALPVFSDEGFFAGMAADGAIDQGIAGLGEDFI